MSAKYLLRCSCGERPVVDAAQAGERLRCSCGAELEVPTLLGLRRLEPAPTATSPARDRPIAWGPRQRLLLLGAILVLAGLGWAAWCFLTRPSMDVTAFPPVIALDYWESLKQGVDAPATPPEKYLALDLEWRTRWAFAGLIAAALGALTMIGSVVVGRTSPKPPGPPSA